MRILEFIDRQFDRIERMIGRLQVGAVAGAGIFILTGLVLFMLYRDRTLADNDLFKTLAQAIIVQGLIGLAMAAWFTKKDEKQATGKEDDPINLKDADE